MGGRGLVLGLVGVIGLSSGVAGAEEIVHPPSPIYQKPFLVKGRASVGGYMDLEFLAGEEGSTFDQHRFVPFVYAEVSDRVHVASEIEYEHGGAVAGDEETDGEISVEFATVDLKAADALNLRAGVILSPLGRLNVFHDAPMLDLTDRPLVDRDIIPTTLSEAGAGFFGQIFPSEQVVLEYEAYLVNGFDDEAVDSSGVLQIREARGSRKSDNNNSRALVARLGVSPRLGTDVGISVHTGDYDQAGEHNLTIAALDARAATGPLEFLGEGALARGKYRDGSGAEQTAGASGLYVEGQVHFLAGAIGALPQSVFTGVTRVDYVDRDQNADGGDLERLTLGVNFRITEETVVKNDLLFDRSRAMDTTEWGDHQTAYRFSVATYF